MDLVFSIPLTILAILGVAANIFLLFVLLTERRIRSKYANFLTIIAAYNIFFTLIMYSVNPTIVNDSQGYSIFSLRLFPIDQRFSFWGCVFQNGSFAIGFAFNSVHSLYRYCTITDRFRGLFSTFAGISLVVISSFSIGSAWMACIVFMMSPNIERLGNRGAEIRRLYGIDLTNDGFFGPQFWDSNGVRWIDLSGTICLSILSSFLFNFNAIVIVKLHGAVKNSIHSAATKNVHMQLIQILITQVWLFLLSTLFTALLPFTLCAVGGFIGLEALTPYTVSVTSAYPILDVFIILLLVKAFRKRTSDILRKFIGKGLRIKTKENSSLPPLEKRTNNIVINQKTIKINIGK